MFIKRPLDAEIGVLRLDGCQRRFRFGNVFVRINARLEKEPLSSREIFDQTTRVVSKTSLSASWPRRA